jgi:ubiquinone/menaquinone biosynthesis C-methylase UbiE
MPSAINEKEIHVLSPESESKSISVREGYDRWAQIYDLAPNPVLALEERYLKNIVPELVGKSALDLACGTGRWIPRLLARGAHRVNGIDLSAGMLRVAGDKAGIRDRLVLGDCTQLPFLPAVFDFALCSFALNHVANLEAVVRELARTLNECGLLIVTEMHPKAYDKGWRPGFRDDRGTAQIETVKRSAERVVATFRDNGFVCLQEHDLFFGEAEFPIFSAAGKSSFFKDACELPAVKVWEFQKLESRTAASMI